MRSRRRIVVAGLSSLLAMALLLVPLIGLRANSLVVDVSDQLVAITAGFSGATLVLFGSTEGDGDVVVVVEGPPQNLDVRRKERVAGIWVNARAVSFVSVPAFYHLATSLPQASFARTRAAEELEVALPRITFASEDDLEPAERDIFQDALIRNRQAEGLFYSAIGDVSFIGDRLFRTNIIFPANVPTGRYLVRTLLIEGGRVVDEQRTPLLVSKKGISGAIEEFSLEMAWAYALLAIGLAGLAGWMAGVAFRD